MATINEIKQLAAAVKNATQVGENTAERVGGVLAGLVEIAEQQDSKLSDLSDNVAIKDEEGNVQDTPFRVIENEEFIMAVVDSEDRLLFGIYRATGKPYFPLNEMYHVEQNEEFFAVWLDAANHVLFGIRRDGQIIGEIHAVNALKQVISQLQSDVAALQEKVGTIDTNLKELLDVFSLQDNEEYLAIEQDSEGKVLSATNPDGSHYIHNAKSETIPTEFSHIEDPEGRTEITTDADGKILSYRDKEGTKHEYSFQVDHLIAEQMPSKTDLSNNSFLQLEEPRLAIINISNIRYMPTTKKDNKRAFVEFWDMRGNYFKKHCILNAQGDSSMSFVKLNVALDFCDDEWIGDITPKIRFGNWVPQDSFHLKAYYTDFFRGVGAVSYKLNEQIARSRGNLYDRPWKKALIDLNKITSTTRSIGNPNVGDYSLLTDTGARCFPDGFPCAVYLNNEFYGIFSFQLKKHRDNYHMDKSTAEHVHLDGTLGAIFKGSTAIPWSEFEIRNPKGIYAVGGNKYDADVKQEEIAGDSEINEWINNGKLPDGTAITSKIKKYLQMTAKVKQYIQGFSNAVPSIKEASAVYEASTKTEDDLTAFKKVFEEYFDKDNLIDYIIISDLIKNSDGYWKNFQWFTYDGRKWWVGLYDCDMTFGAGRFSGDVVTAPITEHLNESMDLPTGFIIKYYNDELNARYSDLAKREIITSENIFGLIKDWTMRIGTSFYQEEYKKWKDSPCAGDSVVRDEYWKLLYDDNGNPQTDTSETFDATRCYSIGDIVSFGINATMGYFKFICVKQTAALLSNTPHTISSYSPIKQFRQCDSLYRIQCWIEKNVENMNKVYKYNN